MAEARDPNREQLVAVARQLGPLRDRLVLLGGCATGLLITDPAAAPVRATRDVDVIVEVATLSEFHDLERRLRRQEFREDRDAGAPICRWRGAAGTILDVMPSDPKLLGFGNRWYRPALASASVLELERALSMRIVSAPYFIATKLEAFRERAVLHRHEAGSVCRAGKARLHGQS